MTDPVNVTPIQMRILEGTYRCLVLTGSSGLSIRDIAKESNVTLSLIHYYFPKKEELLVNAVTYMLMPLVDQLKDTLLGLHSFPDQVRGILHFVRRALEDSDRRKVYFDLMSLAAWSSSMADEVKKQVDRLVSLIADSLRCGELQAEVSPVTLAKVILASSNGLFLYATNEVPKEEVDKSYDLLEQLLLNVRTLPTKSNYSNQ